jgi:hypothetical protein
MCPQSKIQFAIHEAHSKRSPVTARILEGIKKFGQYDANMGAWIVSGQKLRTYVWPHKQPKKQKSSLNDFFNRKEDAGRTRHAGSKTIESNFPGRSWNKTSDVVVLK